MNRHFHRVAVLAALALAMLALPTVAAAAPPANDGFAQATSIAPGAPPFSAQADITEATTEPGEPSFSCTPFSRTVWYSITPSHDGVLRVDVSASSFFDTAINVYEQTGTGFGGLVGRGCGAGTNNTRMITFDAQAGRVYYVQAGSQFGSGGVLRLTLSEVPPPANDSFANAQAISAVPFTATVDVSAAKTEAGEPTACGFAPSTVWYVFTPATTRSVSLSISATNSSGSGLVAAYRGTSLNDLSLLGCRGLFSSSLTFRAEAGSSYWIQAGAAGATAIALRVDLVEAPPPVA